MIMADHKEKQVIDAFVSTITGLTTAGSNVELERQFDWPPETVYAIEVAQGADDPVDDDDQSWGLVTSWTTLFVTLIHKGDKSDAAGALAAMRAEINVALLAYHAAQSSPLGLGFVSDVREVGANPVGTDEFEETESVRIIQWRVRYTRALLDPTQ